MSEIYNSGTKNNYICFQRNVMKHHVEPSCTIA